MAWASCIVTGIITATRGVLLQNGETALMKRPAPISVPRRCLAAPRETMRPIWLTMPVRTRPPVTMNMAAIVQGAEFEKTSSTLSGGTRPSRTTTAAPIIAVTSTGKISRTKRMNIPARTPRVR